MIEFVTLFLGLYHGVQPVELEVTPIRGRDVAEVELWLDDEPTGTLSGPPWTSRVDLGPELKPHELIAVARDAGGDELGRARRWINREVAEKSVGVEETAVVLSLDPGVQLPPVAEMQSWLSIDGEALEVLRVETGHADLLIVRDPEVQPELERTASLFFQFWLDWQPENPLDKEASVAEAKKELVQRGLTDKAVRAEAVWERWNQAYSFGDDVDIRFISPRAAPASRISRRQGVFLLTDARPSLRQGLLSHSAVVRPLQFHPRLADTVAVAGLEAHAGQRRRAVLLMMADEAMGPSRYTPAAVQGYLEDLQVPLWIWKFGPTRFEELNATGAGASGDAPDPRRWSGVDGIAVEEESIGHLSLVTGKIRRALRRQRIVWLRGAHPPHRVELSEQAVGVRLAGMTTQVQKQEARR